MSKPLIISHRGHWLNKGEMNTLPAFIRSFDNGYGVELDVRDHLGELVIAHDPPTGKKLLLFETVLDSWINYVSENKTPILAINIKADGLCEKLNKIVNEEYRKHTFVFDMSIPDTVSYITSDYPIFTRHSELEPFPSFYQECKGVWLDAFEENWISRTTIQHHLDNNKSVCIVSPELHNKNHKKVWEGYKNIFGQIHNTDDKNIMLCTDFVVEGNQFFTD